MEAITKVDCLRSVQMMSLLLYRSRCSLAKRHLVCLEKKVGQVDLICIVSESYKPSEAFINMNRGLQQPQISDRSNVSKVDSLNRARIITNLDEIKDDGYEEFKHRYMTENRQQKVGFQACLKFV